MLLGEEKVKMSYIHIVYISMCKVFVGNVKKSQLVYSISELELVHWALS